MNKPKCKIYPNGSKRWFLNGELHRENEPAIEWASGSKEWYLNGELHREDGPAIERANGSKRWLLNGRFIKEVDESLWRQHDWKELKNENNEMALASR